jgi:hypothetical protein
MLMSVLKELAESRSQITTIVSRCIRTPCLVLAGGDVWIISGAVDYRAVYCTFTMAKERISVCYVLPTKQV